MKLQAGLSLLLAACAASVGPRPPAGAALFKEVAQGGRTLIVAGCSAEGEAAISCRTLEVWRGEAPSGAIVIPRASWRQWRLGDLETRPDARFVIAAGPIGGPGCVLTPADAGPTLEVIGHVVTCVLPLLDGSLPVGFRSSYDRSEGPPLSAGRLKDDLAAPPMTSFLLLARHSECADVRNRLFVIDGSLVFWERVGGCPDNSYGATLFGSGVDDVLCSVHDSIAGPMKRCPASRYSDMFEIIIGHLDRPDLGLGEGHTVRPLDFSGP